jgi:YbgC/YbaW family acyl-CoA thioester hydrolase
MRPKIDKKLFTFKTGWRVRFYEVDLQGVVHHAEMIRYFEIGRVEYWRHLGIGYQDFLDSGYQYVVARVECDYIKPLHFDMDITMMVRIAKFSRTSSTYEYLILDDKVEPAVFGTTVLVCLKAGGERPHPIPAEYFQKVLDFEKKRSVEHKSFKGVEN